MIVVTTPTGNIGSQLVPRLLAAGEKVRVIARDPAKLSAGIQGMVEVVQGSTADPAVLDAAFAGAEALFWLVPPPFDAADIQDYYLGFTRRAAEAIKARGVPRVIGVSSLGRRFGRPAGIGSVAHAMDEMIESTGIDYRALWCPGFMENMLAQIEPIRHQGRFFLPVQPDVKMPHAATDDIAAMAAKLLLDKLWTGHGGVAVMGPQDLSFNDIATIISEVLGKPVRFQPISGEAFTAQLVKLGASAARAKSLVELYAAINEGLYASEPRTPENTTPTSFRRWCEQVLKSAIER